MEDLPDDVLVEVFCFLTPREALGAGSTCKRFQQIARDPRLWRAYAAIGGFGAQLPRTVADADARTLHAQLTALWDASRRVVNVVGAGAGASSCDDEPSQGINCTLSDDEHFWSSTGSADDASEEWLTYRLVQPLCALQAVVVSAYKADYQRRAPVYAPRRVAFDVAHAPDGPFHWSSREFPCAHTSEPQRFDLAGGELPVGGFLRVRLLGRRARQPGDELWYTVIRHVRVLGVPQGVVAATGATVLADAMLRSALHTSEAFCRGVVARAEADELQALPAAVLAVREAELWRTEAPALLADLADLRKRRAELEGMVGRGEIEQAIRMLCTLPPFHELRGQETIDLFRAQQHPRAKNSSTRSGGSSGSREEHALWRYLVELAGVSRLNAAEGLVFAELAFDMNRGHLVEALLFAARIPPTEALGDLLIRRGRLDAAINTFLAGDMLDRLVDTLAIAGRFRDLVRFCLAAGYPADWLPLLSRACEAGKPRDKAVLFGLFLLDQSDAQPNGAVRPGHGLPLDAADVLRVLGMTLPRPGVDAADVLREEYSRLTGHEVEPGHHHPIPHGDEEMEWESGGEEDDEEDGH